jgi:glucose/arabinose dehydrogenase
MFEPHCRPSVTTIALVAITACSRGERPARTHERVEVVRATATPGIVANTAPPAIVRAPPVAPRDACTGVTNALGVRMPPGFCIRAIATGLLRPRGLVAGPGGELIVAESGPGWRHNQGRVTVLRPSAGGEYGASVLLDHLDRPHGIALHGGSLYIAESGRIVRVRYPTTESPPHVHVVVDRLPAFGRHEHKTLGFGPDGRLYFSIGSSTDNCGLADDPHHGEEPCAEAESDEIPLPTVPTVGDAGAPVTARAVIARVDAQNGRASVFARGLRNNLGFAWHPRTRRMWGVDNARDYLHRIDPSLSDDAVPHDELNEIVAGANYGWPYCYDHAVASPEYPSRATYCRTHTRASVDLPPHAAPMTIAFYDGPMFPAEFRGRAFVTLHGYRDTGHRVVSIPFDDDGAPSGPPDDFVSGWEQRPDRPQGHLMGLAVGVDGELFVSDDVNHAVYRIAYGPSAIAAPTVTTATVAIESPAELEARCHALASASSEFGALERTLIDVHCVPCHANAAGGLTLRRCDANRNHATIVGGTSLVYGRYVVPGDPEQGYFMARIHGDSMGPRMPLQGIALSPREIDAFDTWVRHGAPGL